MDEDLRIISRFRSGDIEAFSELVRKYQNGVYSFMLRMIGSEADAQDLTQQVFIRAFKGLKGFRGKGLFRTWLFRIATNVYRSHSKNSPLFSKSGLDNVRQECFEEKVILKEQRQVLRRLISQLPYKQRLTLILKVYHELTFSEIAQVLNCSIGTVKANFHFALNRLREEWPRDEM